MNLKLNQKDKKTLQLGGVGVVAVIVLVFGLQGFDRWKQSKEDLKSLERKIDTLDVSKDRRVIDNLRQKVPYFEMPTTKDNQRSLFMDSIDAQIRAVGINTGPVGEQAGGKTIVPGYDMIRVKSSGNCSFSQLLNLLAVLKQNPYLVGVEELRIKVTTPQQQRGATNIGRGPTSSAGRSSATSSSSSTSNPMLSSGLNPTQTGSAQPAGRGGRQTSYELVVSTLAALPKATTIK